MSEVQDAVQIEAIHDFAIVERPMTLKIRITNNSSEIIKFNYGDIFFGIGDRESDLVEKLEITDVSIENVVNGSIERMAGLDEIRIKSSNNYEVLSISANTSGVINIENMRLNKKEGIATIRVYLLVDSGIEKEFTIEKLTELTGTLDLSHSQNNITSEFTFSWASTNILYCDVLAGDVFISGLEPSGQLEPMLLSETTTFTVFGYTADGLSRPIVAEHKIDVT